MNQDLWASSVEGLVNLWGQYLLPPEMHRSAFGQVARDLGHQPELAAEDVREIAKIPEEACRRLGIRVVG